jgi:soluble lytic murein transglycosylase-like protein
MFAMTTLIAVPAQADIYAFMDGSGVVHFTNVPADLRYAGMVRTPYRVSTSKPVKTSSRHPLTPDRYAPLLEKAAREHSLDRALLQAMIATESGFDPHAVSSKGAVGLMQLMPETARRYGVRNRYDPAENIQGGAKYLRDLMRKFNNDLSLTLAAYNAGEDAIIQYGNRIPPYRETLQYVPRVLTLYRQYQRNVR